MIGCQMKKFKILYLIANRVILCVTPCHLCTLLKNTYYLLTNYHSVGFKFIVSFLRNRMTSILIP